MQTELILRLAWPFYLVDYSFEREYRSKAAVLEPLHLSRWLNAFYYSIIQIGIAGNPDRIASNIITVLFYWCGCYFKDGFNVSD